MKPSDIQEQPQHGGEPDEVLTPEQRARRRLLKLAVYVPPAVIGTLAIGRSAHAQTASCVPASCLPNTQPCGPGDCKPRG